MSDGVDRDNGARPDGPGCEATPSAAQEGVFAESHPSRVDDEIRAIRAAYKALAPLDTLARHRAMNYLEARFDSEMRLGVQAASAVAAFAAAAPGRRAGGLARAASMSPEERSKVARKAARARCNAQRDSDRSGEADETAKQAQPKARARAEGIAEPTDPDTDGGG